MVLTDADYSALPASLTRTVSGSPATVTDPTYPNNPFKVVMRQRPDRGRRHHLLRAGWEDLGRSVAKLATS